MNMRSLSKTGRGAMVGLVALVASAGLSAKVEAATPEQNAISVYTHLPVTKLTADSATKYEMDVIINNRRLNGEVTEGMDIALKVPQYITIVGVELPSSSEDFFSGFEMYPSFNYVKSGDISTRLTDIFSHGVGYGPSNAEGLFGKYFFTVDSNAPVGSMGAFGIDYDNTAFANPDGNAQPFVDSGDAYTITSSAPEPASLSFLAGTAPLMLLSRRKGR